MRQDVKAEQEGGALKLWAGGDSKATWSALTFVPAEVMRMSGAGAPRPASLATCSEACRWGSREKHTTQGPTACVIGAATASSEAAEAGVTSCPTADEAASSDDARGLRQASSSPDSRLSCGSVRAARCCMPSRSNRESDW